jgi:putative membrane protein
MKTDKTMLTAIAIYAAVMTMVLSILSAHAQETDPVKKANKVNDQKADNNIVDEDVADFFVKSADARMMDAQEGKLAAEKGTTKAIREYGKLMVKDQSALLRKIKSLASKRNIALPSDISNKKENGREDLAEETEKDFDDKFIKMMIIDHERDVRLFEKATEFDDPEVSAFAKANLSIIQSHLDKIEAIKELSQ